MWKHSWTVARSGCASGVDGADLSRDGHTHHLARMTLDLTDRRGSRLAKHLRQAIDGARYPLAPRCVFRSIVITD